MPCRPVVFRQDSYQFAFNYGLPPLKGEVVCVSEPEGFGQTTGLTQADLLGGLRRPVGRLCRSKAMDCLVETLAGNVRQARLARLMKNTPLRGAFRLPFAAAHGPSVPSFGEPSGSRSLTLTGRQSQPLRGSPPCRGGPFLPFRRKLI